MQKNSSKQCNPVAFHTYLVLREGQNDGILFRRRLTASQLYGETHYLSSAAIMYALDTDTRL